MQKGVNKKRVRTSYFKTFLITQERRFPCCELIFEWRMIRYICNKMATLLIAGVDWVEHAQGLWYSEGNKGQSGQYVLQYANMFYSIRKFIAYPQQLGYQLRIQYRYRVINGLFTHRLKTLHYPEFLDVLVGLAWDQTTPYKDFRISTTCRAICTQIPDFVWDGDTSAGNNAAPVLSVN